MLFYDYSIVFWLYYYTLLGYPLKNIRIITHLIT
nr:MAG TPA: hypothetical protein [Caudoviricetes sp.]